MIRRAHRDLLVLKAATIISALRGGRCARLNLLGSCVCLVRTYLKFSRSCDIPKEQTASSFRSVTRYHLLKALTQSWVRAVVGGSLFPELSVGGLKGRASSSENLSWETPLLGVSSDNEAVSEPRPFKV